MNEFHTVQDVLFVGDTMKMTVDGKVHYFKLKEVSLTLLHASEAERTRFEISPSGYGIHWPLLDEDLSIDGLLGIVHVPQQLKKIA